MRARVARMVAATALLVAASLAMAGCAHQAIHVQGTAVAAGAPASTGSDPTQLVGAINGFGFDMLRVVKAPGSPNTVISPLSLHAALSMNVNAATRETREQMLAVLGTGGLEDNGNSQWAALLLQLATRNDQQRLEIANSLWGSDGIAFDQKFLETDRQYFGANLATVDFAAPSTPATVNAWFARQTHGMIPHLIDNFDPRTALVLANAAYFKGTWVNEFDAHSTRSTAFTCGNGTRISVPTMHATQLMPMTQGPNYVAAKFDYRGGESALYVVLPNRGTSLDAVAKSMDASAFAGLRTDLSRRPPAEVDVALPKLDTTFGTFDVGPALKSMGMPRAFDAEAAQFDLMTDQASPNRRIFIGDVLHQTRLKLDETGTEAAAATADRNMNGWMDDSAPPPQFICDRPFLIAIVDEPTGALLFLGEIQDPRSR